MTNVAEIFQPAEAVEVPNYSLAELVGMLAQKVDTEADEYNALADHADNLAVELQGIQALLAKTTQELADEKDRSASVIAGNTLLRNELAESKESDRKARVAFDVATEKLKKQAQQISELERALKALKECGDPKKLLEQNKNLRQRNSELMDLNEGLKKQNKAYEASHKELIEKAEFSQLPSYTSPTNEQLFIHPNLITCDTPEGPRRFVALTYWNALGIGRLVTWNGSVPQFASFKHKSVDERWAPSPEAVAWATKWFEDHVMEQGGHQVIRSKFQIKAR